MTGPAPLLSAEVATAIDEGADVFITGDAALARCTEIAVDVLTPTP